MRWISLKKQLWATFIGFGVLGLCLPANMKAQANCSYFASPSGSGTGKTLSAPFRISNFWSVAKPGDTLCLVDGTYTGDNGMIHPPVRLSGISGSPITITAINDGAVLIDGQNARVPVLFAANSWWILQGFNAAHSSDDSVIALNPTSPGDNSTGSNNNILRRIVAWDARDVNSSILLIWSSTNNLVEDFAGFGTARKITQNFARADNNVYRRMFGQWTYSTASVSGPHSTVSLSYDSSGNIAENFISTWDEDPGADTTSAYGLLSLNQYDRFTTDRNEANHNTNSKFLGSIAFQLATQRGNFDGALQGGQAASGITYKDIAIYLEKSGGTESLVNLATEYGGPTKGGHQLINITAIRTNGPSSVIDTDWTITNRKTGKSVSDIYGTQSLYVNDGTKGATICYQYQNGTLTKVPLWPWPMNQRIIDALRAAGRASVDVTATVQNIFGQIPAACRSGATTTTTAVTTSSPTQITPPQNLRSTGATP